MRFRELFHTIVVEKSRDIYESLIDEQDLAEVGGNEVEDLVDEVTIDEEGISEEEEEGEEGEDLGALDAEEELGGEESSEEELEDRVVDLEDALDELKAEFDALMAGEAGEEHAHLGDEGSEESPEEFYEAEEAEEELDEAKEESEESEEDLDETMVREYVEKVAAPSNKTEGGEVGKGGSANVNKQSTVAGKNDMGGSSANIAKGGAEANPDGTSPKATVKPKGELIGKVENSPGAKAGNTFAKKETAVKKEEAGVNKTTPVAK